MSDTMEMHETTLTCPIDICGRQAFSLANGFSKFDGAWRLSKCDNDHRADAKSLIGVLSLGIHAGDTITIATSKDEEELKIAQKLFAV